MLLWMAALCSFLWLGNISLWVCVHHIFFIGEGGFFPGVAGCNRELWGRNALAPERSFPVWTSRPRRVGGWPCGQGATTELRVPVQCWLSALKQRWTLNLRKAPGTPAGTAHWIPQPHWWRVFVSDTKSGSIQWLLILLFPLLLPAFPSSSSSSSSSLFHCLMI